MKKIISYTALILAGIMFSGTTALAGVATVASTQTSAGDTVTLTDPNGNGPEMTFNPSPANLVVIASNTNGFAITTMNTSAADGDRNEYGVSSTNTGYYQNVNASTATPPVFGVVLSTSTDVNADPFSGSWTNMGGGGT